MRSGKISKTIAAFLVAGAFALGTSGLMQVQADEGAYPIENKLSNVNLGTPENTCIINYPSTDITRDNTAGHTLLRGGKLNGQNNITGMLKQKNNYSTIIDGKYMDGFLAEIEFISLGKTVYLDLSSNKDSYIGLGIYDKDGKLLSKTTPYIMPISRLKPMDYNGDSTYEIHGYQQIIGSCNGNTITEMDSLWKYEDGEWHMIRLQYSTFMVK